MQLSNVWDDPEAGDVKIYVVQTPENVIERCFLMSYRPRRPRARPNVRFRHDRVPSLSNGAAAGSRSTLARGAGAGPCPYHGGALSILLAGRFPRRPDERSRNYAHRTSSQSVHGNIRHGFVYERVPHITLKSIANNAEIDVIWDKWQRLEPIGELNSSSRKWEEWEIPREAEDLGCKETGDFLCTAKQSRARRVRQFSEACGMARAYGNRKELHA